MGDRQHYFDSAGNIVNGTRQFAGLVKSGGKGGKGMSPAAAAAKQAKLRAEGQVKYDAKLERAAARKAKGGATLKSAFESKGSGRRRGGNGGGPKRPLLTCKESASGYDCFVGGKRVGSIRVSEKIVTKRHKRGKNAGETYEASVKTYFPSTQDSSISSKSCSKLRVAKRRIADQAGARVS
jgi:hypothetical protein